MVQARDRGLFETNISDAKHCVSTTPMPAQKIATQSGGDFVIGY